MKVCCILYAVLLWTINLTSGIPPTSLRLTQIIFRHGDRTPSEDFPNNQYKEDAWPNGYDQLTQIGIAQMRDLGKSMRNYYDGYLNATYVRDEVYVRSTDKDRTLMSASALLAGLYPPQGFQQWDLQIPWQPIPVHTQPVENDMEISVDVDCLVFDEMYDQALHSKYATPIYRDNKDMIKFVTEKAGWDKEYLPYIWDTYDPLACIIDHPEMGYSLPSWVTEEIFVWLKDMNPDYYYFKGLTHDMRVIKSGPFFKMLSTRLLEVPAGLSNNKMLVYSSHDSMLAAIQIALGVWDGLRPSYASALFFELHEPQPDTYTVRVYHKNDTVDNPMGAPIQITIPGCNFDCPLKDFMSILEPISYHGSVQDWMNLCDGGMSMSGATVAAIFLAVCIVVILSTILIYFLVKRNGSGYVDYSSYK